VKFVIFVLFYKNVFYISFSHLPNKLHRIGKYKGNLDAFKLRYPLHLQLYLT